MTTFDIEAGYLRGVITGAINFRKCPSCDMEGVGLQCYSGETGLPCLSDDPEAVRYECDVCHGVAYIEIPEGE
jgi:hypothetical protein